MNRSVSQGLTISKLPSGHGASCPASPVCPCSLPSAGSNEPQVTAGIKNQTCSAAGGALEGSYAHPWFSRLECLGVPAGIQGWGGKWDPTPGGAGGTEVHPLCPCSPGAPTGTKSIPISRTKSTDCGDTWPCCPPRPTLTLQVKRWRCRNLC